MADKCRMRLACASYALRMHLACTSHALRRMHLACSSHALHRMHLACSDPKVATIGGLVSAAVCRRIAISRSPNAAARVAAACGDQGNAVALEACPSQP